MENIKIKYLDIENRKGSEDLFKWYKGKNVVGWKEKEGQLLSLSVASLYDEQQRHLIIPVGLVQENISGKILVVPTNRITIKN